MESLMETLVDRRTNNNGVVSRSSLRPTRRLFVSSAAWYAPCIDSRWSAPIASPSPGLWSIAPNHDSVLDGIIFGAAISQDLRFLAKAELWRSRLLAWMLDGLGAVGIKRGHGDHLALARMRQALEAGQAVAIFPQGAIYGDRVWHRGAARMALVTGAPLVPVRLVGTAQALSRGRITSRGYGSTSESRSQSHARRKNRSRRRS